MKPKMSIPFRSALRWGLMLALACIPALTRAEWWNTNMEVAGQLASPGSSQKIITAGDRAYILARTSQENYIGILNIGDPLNPRVEGLYFPDAILIRDMVVSGTTLVYAEEMKISLVDVKDPTNPQLIGSILIQNAYFAHLAASGSNILAASNQGLGVIDISDPKNPSYKIVDNFPCAYLAVANQKLCVGGGAIRVYDLADEAHPQFLTSYPLISTQWMISVGSKIYAIAQTSFTFSYNLYVIDTSNLPDADEVSSYNLMWNIGSGLAAIGQHAFIGGKQIYALDTSNPLAPDCLRGSFVPADYAYDMKAVGPYLYVAASTRGLIILKYTGPDQDVSVLSPKAGDRWEAGNKERISWKTNLGTAGTSVRFELWRGETKACDLGSDSNPKGAGSAKVALPKSLTPGDDYVLRAISASNPALWAQSPKFSIKK